MTVQSLMEHCSALGIKLSVKADDNDRLLVDAPKGTLTPSLREALAAHKLDLIEILKAGDQDYSITQTRTPPPNAGENESGAPATNAWKSPEGPSSSEQPSANLRGQFDPTDVEVKKLLSGNKYDENIIEPKESAARHAVATKLLEALGGRNLDQHDHARRAFMNHGYFDETTRQLRTADSPAERASAARKLGVVGSPMATAHLIASLHDSAPEVRRASTESLAQLGDPAAIPSLNELLSRETSRQLPEAVIRQAINSIAVTKAKRPTTQQPAPAPLEKIVEKPAAQPEAAKPVQSPELEMPSTKSDLKKQRHEIFAEYLSAFEQRELSASTAPITMAEPADNVAESRSDAINEKLRLEEEALRKAAEALEHKRLEAEAARKMADDEIRMKLERETQIRMEVETRMRAEEEARRRMAEEAARQRAEEEARIRDEHAAQSRAAEEARLRAENETRLRAEEETQFRLEAETLRKAAEELARKRAEAEAKRKLAEEEALRKATEEAIRLAEEQARARVEEEVRRKAEEEVRRRIEEELRRRAEEEAQARVAEEARIRAAVEASIRAEAEAQRQAEEELERRAEEEARQRKEEERVRARAAEEACIRGEVEARIRAEAERQRRVEEELRLRADEDANKAAEGARLLREAEERHRLDEARLLVDQETLMQVAAELLRRRTELDEARKRADGDARLLVEAQHRAKTEESRLQMEAERQRGALDRKRLSDESLLADSLRRAAEEQQQGTAQARMHAEEQERYLDELGSVKSKLEAEARRRSEQERHIKAEILELSKAEEEQRLRIEGEIKRRNEALTRLQEQESRAEEEALKSTEELRLKAEAQVRRRSEAEASLRQEEARLQAEQEAHARAEGEARRLAEEARLKAQAEATRRAEAEARLREEEAKLQQAEQAARAKAEAEAHRLAEEIRLNAEAEACRRAEAEARLKEEESRLQAEDEAQATAEAEVRRMAEEIRLRADEEARRRAELETHVKADEARLQAEQQARLKAEREAQLVAEEIRLKAEEQARRLLEAEARVRDERAQQQAGSDELDLVVEVPPRLELEVQQEDQAPLQLAEETHSSVDPFQAELMTNESSASDFPWIASTDEDEQPFDTLDKGPADSVEVTPFVSLDGPDPAKGLDRLFSEKGITSAEDNDGIPSDVLKRLSSSEASERLAALREVVQIGGDDAFRYISRAFDDQIVDVRNAAARALYDLNPDRAATFTRALREGTTERRRKIGQALANSGLAAEAVGNLTGESREKTYDAFSLLFLMAKAGEVQPLMHAIEEYPNVEVRIAVVKLLALSGQPEIVPAFRRLAVRGSLPSEVRSAVMEAIYQISSQARESAPSAA